MAEKKTIKIKLMLRTIVWYFSNGWLFLPFTLLQVNYADMVHAWYRENGFYHWTYHSCSSNTIHYYHGGGGVGTIVHILAHITGKLVCIFPVTPDTVFFFFFNQNSGSNLDWNEKEPIHNRGDSLYIEITCACSIGNKVLVIGNTNVRFYSLWWQALHPQAHAGLSRHDHAHERGNRGELQLDTDPLAALWILSTSSIRREMLHWSEIGV